MSIESLTIISPRPVPIQYTSLDTIAVSGGVYSPNLSHVEVLNPATAQGAVTATIINVGGNEYTWEVTNLSVASQGNNIITVTAYDMNNDSVSQEVRIYVDYISPAVSLALPMNNATNVATNTSIQIYFNETMSVSDTIPALSITPEIPGGTWALGATGNLFIFTPPSNIEPYTTYTVTISTDAKDSIATIDTADVYGTVGNNLQAVKTVSFTTGAGIGANDPTRQGFNPPEPILKVVGDVIDETPVVDGKESVSNPAVFEGYLSGLYVMSDKEYSGSMQPIELPTLGTYGAVPNPPGLIDVFRRKAFWGKVNDVEFETEKSNNIVPNPSQGYLSTQYTIRQAKFDGLIFDMTDIENINHIPIVLSYSFDDEVSGGALHKLDSRFLSITWTNPRDKEKNRLVYEISLSRKASFFNKISFNSIHNPEAFWIAENDVDFIQMTELGSPSGKGKTRFLCPVELDSNIWYVRLRVANKKE